MQESSGRYCEGRDRAANNTESDTAEAGLFQTSFNANIASPFLFTLFNIYQYQVSKYLEIFEEGVVAKAKDLENFGSGNGFEFQLMSKSIPEFATEFAAVGVRNIRTHWGTINNKTVEIRPECNQMFLQVQHVIDITNTNVF